MKMNKLQIMPVKVVNGDRGSKLMPMENSL